MSVTRVLKWQWDIDGDIQKMKLFQDVVGGLQNFRTYLIIKPGRALCDGPTLTHEI